MKQENMTDEISAVEETIILNNLENDVKDKSNTTEEEKMQ